MKPGRRGMGEGKMRESKGRADRGAVGGDYNIHAHPLILTWFLPYLC